MNVRLATPADLPAVFALERACATAAHWSEAEYRLVFDPGATPRLLLVAEEVGAPHIAPRDAASRTDLSRDVWELVGFIIVRTLGPEWEIENIAVDARSRGRGIGKTLVQAVVAQARLSGAESVFLEVRASNAAARALYNGSGFVETGHRRGYYSSPDEDAALYRLHVGDTATVAP